MKTKKIAAMGVATKKTYQIILYGNYTRLEKNMKIVIKNEKLSVVVQAEQDLEIEQVKAAYELVTGKIERISHEQKEILLDPKKIIEQSPKHESETVRADVQCPFCGFAEIVKVFRTNKFVKCPSCGKRLFLSWINGNRGELDEHNCYFTANTEFHSRAELDSADDGYEKNAKTIQEYADMFKKSDDPDVPDSTNTIAEITKYLDDKGIDHTGITLKGKLLELVK